MSEQAAPFVVQGQLPTPYQELIHISRYSRYDYAAGRRETWSETVNRYVQFFREHLAEQYNFVNDSVMQEIGAAILNLEAMPSMRALMTAGPALTRDHLAGYNCCFSAVDSPRVFDEALFILMCGAGLGFSVERQFVSQLPAVPDILHPTDTVIMVRDSKLGWAKAYKQFIAMLYAGEVPKWDVSNLRQAGAPLKVFGGRASGPGPLVELFEFTIRIFAGARGRKLNSIECHDLMCKIGEVVVAGGVRRSALLSLSNLSDQRMRDAKSGAWWEYNSQRQLANNSVAYTEKPDPGQFMAEWLSLYESKSGERGIFNREAARRQAMSSGRRKGYWDEDGKQPIEFGCNPCSEILLRSEQTCNLTESVVREHDKVEDLARKIRIASIMGTFQSTLTNFRYVNPRWKKNCEEERLLGVSLTGIMDSKLLNHRSKNLPDILRGLKDVAIEANKEFAERLGINQSTAITTVKPSGTVSQLVNSSSGIHARYAPYYIRRVRLDAKDPVNALMQDCGFKSEPDVRNSSTTVYEFPMRSPKGAIVDGDRSAIEQLEHWKVFQDHWCEHKPSVTINVHEREWPAVGGWVYDNFDAMSGVSFLPRENHTYKQTPYEAVDEETVRELEDKMPKAVNWSNLTNYESEDGTTGSREFACTAGSCEL